MLVTGIAAGAGVHVIEQAKQRWPKVCAFLFEGDLGLVFGSVIIFLSVALSLLAVAAVVSGIWFGILWVWHQLRQ